MSVNRKLSLSELNRVSIAGFKDQKKIPLVLVADNIRSAMNIGSLFRTADAFAIEAIYLVGISACPPHKEIHKTAIGATHSVDWKYFETVKEVIDHLVVNEFRIINIEQTEQSMPLGEMDVRHNEKYAIVVGNEVNGVSEEFLKFSSQCLEIPQYGTKHSLNVSVCAGIVLYAFTKEIRRNCS